MRPGYVAALAVTPVVGAALLLAGALPVAAQSCTVEIDPNRILVNSGPADTTSIVVSGSGFPADAPLTLDFQPVGSILDYFTDGSGNFREEIPAHAETVYVLDDPDAHDYVLVATAWEGDEPPHLQPTIPDRLCEAEARYSVVSGNAGMIPNTASTEAAGAESLNVGIAIAAASLIVVTIGLARRPVRVTDR